MAYSYNRTAGAPGDNSYGLGKYPLPPALSHLGRFADCLAPAKLLDHKYFVRDEVHMLTTKVGHGFSVMAVDMMSLLRLGLTRIQSNEPGTVDFYFQGYPVGPASPFSTSEEP